MKILHFCWTTFGNKMGGVNVVKICLLGMWHAAGQINDTKDIQEQNRTVYAELYMLTVDKWLLQAWASPFDNMSMNLFCHATSSFLWRTATPKAIDTWIIYTVGVASNSCLPCEGCCMSHDRHHVPHDRHHIRNDRHHDVPCKCLWELSFELSLSSHSSHS